MSHYRHLIITIIVVQCHLIPVSISIHSLLRSTSLWACLATNQFNHCPSSKLLFYQFNPFLSIKNKQNLCCLLQSALLETFLPEGITLCRLKYTVHPTQPTTPSSSSFYQVPLHHHIPCNCPPPSFAAHLSRPGPYLNILESRRGTPFLTYLLHILRYSFATNRPHCQRLIFFFLSPIHHPCCCHCTTYRSRQVFSPLSPISTCYLHQLVIN